MKVICNSNVSVVFQDRYTTIIRSQFHDFTLPARGIINVPHIKKQSER